MVNLEMHGAVLEDLELYWRSIGRFRGVCIGAVLVDFELYEAFRVVLEQY